MLVDFDDPFERISVCICQLVQICIVICAALPAFQLDAVANIAAGKSARTEAWVGEASGAGDDYYYAGDYQRVRGV